MSEDKPFKPLYLCIVNQKQQQKLLNTMKVLFKSFLLALTLLAAFSAIIFMTASAAQGHPTTNPTAPTAVRSAVFPSATGNSLHVVVEKATDKPVVIRLVDKQGNMLGSQVTGKKSGSYRVKFNIEQLKDGEYEIELVNGDVVSHHSFTVSTPQQVEVNRTIALMQ